MHNCAPACAIMHNQQFRTHIRSVVFIFLFFNMRIIHDVAAVQSKSESGNFRENTHNMYCASSVVSIISLILHFFLLPLPLLFSLTDPISAVLQYREVMMRNGVIMPVVKPQAAQQMCFRDPAFVSERIRSLLW